MRFLCCWYHIGKRCLQKIKQIRQVSNPPVPRPKRGQRKSHNARSNVMASDSRQWLKHEHLTASKRRFGPNCTQRHRSYFITFPNFFQVPKNIRELGCKATATVHQRLAQCPRPKFSAKVHMEGSTGAALTTAPPSWPSIPFSWPASTVSPRPAQRAILSSTCNSTPKINDTQQSQTDPWINLLLFHYLQETGEKRRKIYWECPDHI